MPDDRQVQLTTPLGEGVLQLRRMTGTEELGRMFTFELDLVSENEDLEQKDLLGKDVTVTLELPDGGERHFHGFVSRFAYAGRHGNRARYRAVVRPWLWFLTRTTDCRIFQNMTVPAIVRQVFSDLEFTDVRDELAGTYREWEYCVQYRETAFNFVSRLLEQEGIYYYFVHSEGVHELVLADSYGAHEPCPGAETVPYMPPSEQGPHEESQIEDWSFFETVEPARYVIDEYDFKRPAAELRVQAAVSREHEHADGEIFDYPGEYVTVAEGQEYAAARVNELQCGHLQAEGRGNVRGLRAGGLFSLDLHPREDQNIEYLVTSDAFEIVNPELESGAGDGAPRIFSVRFSAIPAARRYVPRRTTPKPIVPGPQTAIVTGKAGEEIWTDEHGRVCVQFHWDRRGKRDENSSCWIRVSQVWAGKQWGAIHIPRIGQEVVVDFLEGDPDRPIITGRVYHGKNKPPYPLPGRKTQSGIKSRSSKGGAAANFNELRFEDETGSEQVFLQAEKDFETVVENDESSHVMNDRTKTIDNDETNHIVGNRTETVDGDETIEVGNNRTESVGADETLTVVGNRDETIGANETRTVMGSVTEQVTGAVTQTYSSALIETALGGITINTPQSIKMTGMGGITHMAPGGWTTVDSFFDSDGGFLMEIFAVKYSMVNIQQDIIGISQIAVVNNKVEQFSLKLEAIAAKIVNEAAKATSVGMALKNSGPHLMLKAFRCIL